MVGGKNELICSDLGLSAVRPANTQSPTQSIRHEVKGRQPRLRCCWCRSLCFAWLNMAPVPFLSVVVSIVQPGGAGDAVPSNSSDNLPRSKSG